MAAITSSLHVRTLNSGGFPLFILHGWGQSSKEFTPLGDLLTTDAAVHLVDLPGFGNAPPPEKVYSTLDYAHELADYLDHAGIDQIDLLGHSFGGKVAMSFAIRYPNRVRNLILVSSSGIKRERSIFEKGKFKLLFFAGRGCKIIDQVFRTHLFEKRFATQFGSKDYRMAKGIMRSILVKSVNEDIRDQLNQIRARTAILWGENDQETPVSCALKLKEGIPDSSLTIFPGKDHYIYSDGGYHLLARTIIRFLKGEPT